MAIPLTFLNNLWYFSKNPYSIDFKGKCLKKRAGMPILQRIYCRAFSAFHVSFQYIESTFLTKLWPSWSSTSDLRRDIESTFLTKLIITVIILTIHSWRFERCWQCWRSCFWPYWSSWPSCHSWRSERCWPCWRSSTASSSPRPPSPSACPSYQTIGRSW